MLFRLSVQVLTSISSLKKRARAGFCRPPTLPERKVADFFAEAMGLKEGESIDEELYVTDATNESVSGSVSGTAEGAKADEGSRNSGGPARRRRGPTL